MKDLFVPYELALKVREKGFDEPCLMCYYGLNLGGQPEDKLYIPSGFGHVRNSHENVLTAPIWQQVLDWLFNNHEIDVIATPEPYSNGRINMRKYKYSIYSNGNGKLLCTVSKDYYMKKRNAIHDGILEALKMI